MLTYKTKDHLNYVKEARSKEKQLGSAKQWHWHFLSLSSSRRTLLSIADINGDI